MSGDLYAKAKAIFQEAMERPRTERTAYVAGACGRDDELRREVESWISASDRAGSAFLDTPAAKMCVTCDSSFAVETKFCPHCGQVLQDDPRALVGTRLDNLYQIEELLGTGGMGAVYRARHALLGDEVAIKMLKRDFGDSPTFLKRFQREGQAARSFHHPNAVVVHDLRTTPAGLIYMVLELIEGVNLRKLLVDRKRFSPTETVELLEPVASVLDAAHRKGVVHRDMKPENVMISPDGHGGTLVKVLDLGIAKMHVATETEQNVTELTAVGQVLGTPPYMSPEQWGHTPRDDGGDVDGRADVYSLGVMAHEMVTGQLPFSAKTLEAFKRAHLLGEIPLANATHRDVSERFARAVARALAKDRADRWSTAGEFVAELKAAARDAAKGGSTERMTQPEDPRSTAAYHNPDPTVLEPATAESSVAASPVVHTPAPVPAERVEGKSRGKLWAAVAVAVVLLGGSALAYRLMSGGTAAPDPQPQPPAPAPAPAASVDALRFTIEVRGKDGSTSRVSGKDPIGAKIDGWRLLFTPAARGRIAVIGPNERNIPTLFLPVSGEPLEPGASAVFPTRDWFHTTADTPSDTVTIVFIPEGAVKPAFVAGKEMRQLTVDEQRDLEQFRKANAVAPQFGDDGATRIAAPKADQAVAADVTVRY